MTIFLLCTNPKVKLNILCEIFLSFFPVIRNVGRLPYRDNVSIRRVEMHAGKELLLGGTVSFVYVSPLAMADFLLFVVF